MANLNIRVDDTLKKQTEAVLDSIGLSLSAATILYYKQIIRHNGVPFDLRASPADEKKSWITEYRQLNREIHEHNLEDPLPKEFDKILKKRVNFKRKINL
ncbi:MAG: type II toxin-antitoxin system RelB/DinJ family antitoxin [Treponema sp.]|jgi:addiction module RelB/DinJ family antitoxin|nr:type II toxin-antitoxin system RelB/DinJ family antitoxin [Treponema sp.]